MSNTLLCLDIGSGTQDVLLYSPDKQIENCPKFIIPTPAIQIGRRIERLRMQKKNIYLHGHNMGGGVTRFIRAHQNAGLRVASSESAAYTMADDLSRLLTSGIELSETCPEGYEPVHLTDFDKDWWSRFFETVELQWPDAIIACAQDHGYHPGESNRKGRFKLWQMFLEAGQGRPEALIYKTPPSMLTRLIDLQEDIDGGFVADTGAAAILGALYVGEIEQESYQHGITIVNIGNSHLIAFLLYKGRVYGVYEQHTGCVTSETLWSDLELFRCGCLSFEKVFDAKGHGCLTHNLPDDAHGFKPTYVLGPQRHLLKNYNVSFPSPGGDMMLAGCFGLIKGTLNQA